MMEDNGSYQLDLMHDGVVFTFTPWSPLAKPVAKSKSPLALPEVKVVHQALLRPTRKQAS